MIDSKQQFTLPGWLNCINNLTDPKRNLLAGTREMKRRVAKNVNEIMMHVHERIYSLDEEIKIALSNRAIGERLIFYVERERTSDERNTDAEIQYEEYAKALGGHVPVHLDTLVQWLAKARSTSKEWMRKVNDAEILALANVRGNINRRSKCTEKRKDRLRKR